MQKNFDKIRLARIIMYGRIFDGLVVSMGRSQGDEDYNKYAMTGKATNIGAAGERQAAEYLVSLGYVVLESNYRCRHREIDLIVEKEGLLVFVEVKTRASDAFMPAPYAVNRRKQMFLCSAAAAYVCQRSWKREIRFDIIWVENTGKGRYRVVAHIKNAFNPFGG